MKVFSVTLSLLLTAGFIQTAAGLQCDSECAACWKTGDSNGADIKLSCSDGDGHCGDKCPGGYDRMHCATRGRCHCKMPDCGPFGPCACGEDVVKTAGGEWKDCKLGGC